MADLSKIKLNGIEYDLKDAIARIALEDKTNTTDLAQVAFSGDYNDLINKPVTEPAEYTIQFQDFFLNYPRFQLVDNTDENETIRDNLRTGNVKINRILSLQYDPLNSLPTDNYIYNDYQLIQDVRKTNSEIILYKRIVDFGGAYLPAQLYEDYLIFCFQSNLSLYIFHYYKPQQNFDIVVVVGSQTLPHTTAVSANRVWGKDNLAKAKKMYAPFNTTLRVVLSIQGDNVYLNPYETVSQNALPRYYGESKKLGKKFVITFSDFEDGVQPTALVEEVSETQIQVDWNQTDETAVDFIKNKPQQITEQNVADWGFTKNTGTYVKPVDGIPASDLASGVIPDISGKANAADVYTKTEVDQKLVGAMDFKGTKATVAELPTFGSATGDVWHITSDGSEWAWNGSAWEELGTAVDLSGYRTASAQDTIDAAQDAAIAAKYTKPNGGIPKSDLANEMPFFELPSGGQSGQALLSDGNGGAVWGQAQGGGSGLTDDVKQALLSVVQAIAIWSDDDAQGHYDELYAALYPPKNLVSISAAFNQGTTVIYNTDNLNRLKQYLTVAAIYDDSTTSVVTNYTLFGTLTVGTSVITVSYGGKTTTFNVVVTAAPPVNYINKINATANAEITLGIAFNQAKAFSGYISFSGIGNYSMIFASSGKNAQSYFAAASDSENVVSLELGNWYLKNAGFGNVAINSSTNNQSRTPSGDGSDSTIHILNTCTLGNLTFADASGNTIADLRPCKDPNNVVCWHDEVLNQYVYNTGTGTLTEAA